jgi:drug/metabolite transporter (DMT)-like permease
VLGSFTPVMAALRGEFPSRLTWLAIVLVSVGVVLASGGLLIKESTAIHSPHARYTVPSRNWHVCHAELSQLWRV